MSVLLGFIVYKSWKATSYLKKNVSLELNMRTQIASCLIYAWAIVWVRSFIEPDLFDNNVPFDNTTSIYLINLPWKLG